MLKLLTMWITTNCAKLLKRWKYQTSLPASWETCMQQLEKKWQLEPDVEQQTRSKLEKEYVFCILSPCLFNFCAEYIMWNARPDESQAGIKIVRRNINNLRYTDDTTLMAESEELKSLLTKGKEESENVGLKLNIQKTKIVASSPISSVQFSSVTQSCLTLCDPMNHSAPGFPVHHQLPQSTQTHVHWVGDTMQPSHPLLSPSPPALNLSQHQGLFQWVSSSHQVAKVLEFQLQHQSFQWTPRTDLL